MADFISFLMCSCIMEPFYTAMRSEKSTFETLYRALNPRQREAVDAIEGPVIVIAGPGTGKTQVLTLRIANILKRTDVGPEGILALTFTNSGVAAMRARLAEIIGSAAYRVNIYTFHGFANAVIQRFPEYFPRIIGARTADRIDSLRLVERAVLARHLKAIKPFGNPLYYVSSIVNAIKFCALCLRGARAGRGSRGKSKNV